MSEPSVVTGSGSAGRTQACQAPKRKGPAAPELISARQGFMKLYGKTLPAGTIILKSPDREAVSEGIGFGGLLLVQDNSTESQKAFWGLYRARKEYFLKPNGVMAWRVDLSGRKIGQDSASDGDQDWIAAEIMALQKIKAGEWQLPPGMSLADLEKQVQTDLAAFWKAHVRERNGRLLFLSTDGSWARRGDGREVYYPSYPDPHFLRLFSCYDQSRDWNKLAADVQELNQAVLAKHDRLGAAGQNPMPAKVFVSVGAGGKFVVENYYTISHREGVRGEALKDNELDSIRFFLRQARAAVLGGDTVARDMLRRIVEIARVADPYSVHILAGAEGAPHRYGYPNTLARAGYGAALLGAGDSRAGEFCRSVMGNHQGDFFGEWAGAKDYYYDQAIILQVLDLFNQK